MTELWREGALCAQSWPDAWFPEHGGHVKDSVRAVATCFACPVRAQCLEYAVEHAVDEGIWGGLTPGQRKRLKRKDAA